MASKGFIVFLLFKYQHNAQDRRNFRAHYNASKQANAYKILFCIPNLRHVHYLLILDSYYGFRPWQDKSLFLSERKVCLAQPLGPTATFDTGDNRPPLLPLST